MINSGGVKGYVFEADIWCPACMEEHLGRAGSKYQYAYSLKLASAESMLDSWAKRVGFKRDNEHSFDSDEFPKVILDQDEQEICKCGETI